MMFVQTGYFPNPFGKRSLHDQGISDKGFSPSEFAPKWAGDECDKNNTSLCFLRHVLLILLKTLTRSTKHTVLIRSDFRDVTDTPKGKSACVSPHGAGKHNLKFPFGGKK